MLCTVCCACADASWTLCRCYKAIHQRLEMMLAKESDGLRAEAERLCESDQEAHACQWSSTKGIVLPALNIVQGTYSISSCPPPYSCTAPALIEPPQRGRPDREADRCMNIGIRFQNAGIVSLFLNVNAIISS